MQTHWESMSAMPQFAALKSAIQCGLQTLKKYYQYTDNTSVNMVCLGKYLSSLMCQY
jgi:hypothetical protein